MKILIIPIVISIIFIGYICYLRHKTNKEWSVYYESQVTNALKFMHRRLPAPRQHLLPEAIEQAS